MSDLYEELVETIKVGMDCHQITQSEVARRSGVPQGNLSKILRGQRPNTTLATWDKLLEVFE